MIINKKTFSICKVKRIFTTSKIVIVFKLFNFNKNFLFTKNLKYYKVSNALTNSLLKDSSFCLLKSLVNNITIIIEILNIEDLIKFIKQDLFFFFKFNNSLYLSSQIKKIKNYDYFYILLKLFGFLTLKTAI